MLEMSQPNQIVSQEPSASQKGKEKAPQSQPLPEETRESVAQQAEGSESPAESRHLTPNNLPFKPFFTLIEDVNSSDHHNPTVHYIFSDDDTDLITEAALRSLEPDGPAHLPPGSYNDDGDDDQADHPHRRDPKHSSLPPQIPGVQEHYIVLDMQPSPAAPGPFARPQSQSESTKPQPANTESATTTPQTYTVTSAHSLAPTWQVLNTELSPAPTFETSPSNDDDTSDPSQGDLMLKIKGTAGFKPDPARGRGNDQGQDQNLEEMMEQFEKRMGELRRVIEAGDVVEENQNEGREEEGEKGGEKPVEGKGVDNEGGIQG